MLYNPHNSERPLLSISVLGSGLSVKQRMTEMPPPQKFMEAAWIVHALQVTA